MGSQVFHLKSTLPTVAARGILLKNSSDHIILHTNPMPAVPYSRPPTPTPGPSETLGSKGPPVRTHHCGSILADSSDSPFGFAVWPVRSSFPYHSSNPVHLASKCSSNHWTAKEFPRLLSFLAHIIYFHHALILIMLFPPAWNDLPTLVCLLQLCTTTQFLQMKIWRLRGFDVTNSKGQGTSFGGWSHLTPCSRSYCSGAVKEAGEATGPSSQPLLTSTWACLPICLSEVLPGPFSLSLSPSRVGLGIRRPRRRKGNGFSPRVTRLHEWVARGGGTPQGRGLEKPSGTRISQGEWGRDGDS